jgi:hypothetical protein
MKAGTHHGTKLGQQNRTTTATMTPSTTDTRCVLSFRTTYYTAMAGVTKPTLPRPRRCPAGVMLGKHPGLVYYHLERVFRATV